MSEKYYIKIQIGESKNASSKAVNDCNQILEQYGIKALNMELKTQGNKYIKKINNYLQVKKIDRVESNSLVFVPHPIYLNKKYMDILKDAKKMKHIQLAFLVHDLESLRKMFPEMEDSFNYMDKMMYELADYVIAHNRSLKQYLIDQGIDEITIYNLPIFDYLTGHNPDDKSVRFAKTLNVAGNLDSNKCQYIKGLNNLDQSVKVNLYGLNFNQDALKSKSVHYMGAFPADDIPAQLTEGFGLVWDGDTIAGCAGDTGNYLRFNNPHKLSLYLVSGIPVVIWSQAAEAQFVKEHQVGIIVDSVEDFAEAFDCLSEAQYNQMVLNSKKISRELRSGTYLKHVIRRIC